MTARRPAGGSRSRRGSYLQLYRAAEATGWINRPGASRYQGAVLHGRGAEACGLDAPLACRVDQDTLAGFLVKQTSLYHREEIRRGKLRGMAPHQPLLFPALASGQLRLELGGP